MTHSVSELTGTAGQLASWFGIWRILVIVGGVIGGLASLLTFGLFGSLGDALPGGSGALRLLPLLVIGAVVLTTWLYATLLGWGKVWVESSASAAQHGDAAELSGLQGSMDRWLAFFIWGTLAYLVVTLLIVWGTASMIGSAAPGGGGFRLVVLGLLSVMMLVMFLVAVYFPLTALRNFLAQATARLGGSALKVRRAAGSLQTWTWVIVAIQGLSLLSNVFGFFSVDNNLGPVFGLFGLVLTAGFAALYIIPLVLTGKFATLLGRALDSRKPTRSASPAAPLPDIASIGRMADNLDDPRHW